MCNFPEMRRKRQLLSDKDAVSILRHATSGVLSVVDSNGYPYVDGKIYFHSAVSGHKIDAISHNGKATFTVVAQDEVHPETFTTHFRSVVCFGRVRLIDDDVERLAALRMLAKRYNTDEEAIRHEIDKDFKHVAVIEFLIEHITGKEAIEIVRARQAKE